MKEMIINGQNVAEGRVVKTLEAMLNGATDDELREQFNCYKWDEQFYEVHTEVIGGITFMVKKEFNCLVVWMCYGGPTSFHNGDEFVQRYYHPLCIIDRTRDDEYQDICRDIANGLIRLRLLNADEYIGFKED